MAEGYGSVNVYDFRMTLAGCDEFTVELADRLFEAGCDDATFGTSNGVHFGAFHREAESLGGAIGSAVNDVAKTGFSVARVEVERRGD